MGRPTIIEYVGIIRSPIARVMWDPIEIINVEYARLGYYASTRTSLPFISYDFKRRVVFIRISSWVKARLETTR